MGCCCLSDRNKDDQIIVQNTLAEIVQLLRDRKRKNLEELAQIRCYMVDSNKFKDKFKVRFN